MREILSRGKRVDNGEWVEGSLITDVFYRVGKGNKNSIPYILSVSGIDYDSWEDLDDDYGLYEVDPDTVGQYTGLTDKNGKRVFTDCIVTDGFDSIIGIVRFGEYSNPVADGYHIGFYIEWGGKYHDILRKDLGYWAKKSNFEVIGNIYDNPELLEDKPDD